MSPEERQLLQGVFDRMRNNSSAPRDPEADRLIADNVRQQPYSPYYLTQAVIVQEQALQAANGRIQQLEQQAQQAPQQSTGGGGFLSSIFGGGSQSRDPVPAGRPPVWNQGSTQAPPPGYGQQPNYGNQQGYAPPPPQGGPWGGAPQGGGGGGGFLKGALGTAAGVAGGALMFEGIRNLMGGHGGGFGGLGLGAGVPGVPQETVVNNYYGDGGSAQTAADYQQDMAQDAQDDAGGGATAADWQQDADQDQDDAQDAGDYGGDDGSYDV